eukprot:12865222-Alexandrium_andersonii.AAC.1
MRPAAARHCRRIARSRSAMYCAVCWCAVSSERAGTRPGHHAPWKSDIPGRFFGADPGGARKVDLPR